TSGHIDPEEEGYLRLTDAHGNQVGYARSLDRFPVSHGLKFSFEYYTYGGSGGDGLAFFLYDPTADPFLVGPVGGALGYTQSTDNGGIPGLSKAYLGIALD